MPKWVLRRADTTPTPSSRAIAIASCIARVPTTKPNTILSIQRGRDRRDPLGLEHGTRIDQAAPKAVEVARQAAKPVGVDAAQIRADEAGGDDRCVVFGHAMGAKQAPREGVRRAGLDVEARGFERRRRRHQSLISLTCCARAAQALNRKARSVPVET